MTPHSTYVPQYLVKAGAQLLPRLPGTILQLLTALLGERGRAHALRALAGRPFTTRPSEDGEALLGGSTHIELLRHILERDTPASLFGKMRRVRVTGVGVLGDRTRYRHLRVIKV